MEVSIENEWMGFPLNESECTGIPVGILPVGHLPYFFFLGEIFYFSPAA